MNARLKWVSDNIHGKKILDIGFAEKLSNGTLVYNFIRKNNPNSFIVPFDVSNDLFEYNFENIVQGNVLNLPFKDNYFDCVSLMEVIEHLWDPTQAMKEIARVISPGGKLFLTTPNPYDLIRVIRFVVWGKSNLGGDKDHKSFFIKGNLEKLLKKYNLVLLSFNTVNLRIPKLRKSISKNPFPFQYLGNNQCIIAQKGE